MQRRSFIKSLLTLAIAPHSLPDVAVQQQATLAPSPTFVFDPDPFIALGPSSWLNLVKRGLYPDQLGRTTTPLLIFTDNAKARRFCA